VVLTSATLALSEDFVQVTSLGPMGVRGLRDAVEVYELVGANSASTPTDLVGEVDGSE
jgi:hypothetical protein